MFNVFRGSPLLLLVVIFVSVAGGDNNDDSKGFSKGFGRREGLWVAMG